MPNSPADFEPHSFNQPGESPTLSPAVPCGLPSASNNDADLRAANERLQAELERLRADLARERDAANARREPGLETRHAQCSETEDDCSDTEDESEREAPVPSQGASSVSGGEAMASPGQEHEESIESYMAALLTRMRGGEGASVVVAQPAPRRERRAAAHEPMSQPETPQPEPVDEQPPVIATPHAPRELTPRPRVEIADLTAMRELANTQCRMAIHAHSRKQLTSVLFARSAVAAACLAVSAVALRFWPVEHQLMFGCSMAGLVAGIYWMLLAAKDLQKFLAWFGSRESQPQGTQARSESDRRSPTSDATT